MDNVYIMSPDTYYNLTHYDPEHQARIDAFLEECSRNISVTSTPGKIIVETSDIDEDAILAILQNTTNNAGKGD